MTTEKARVTKVQIGEVFVKGIMLPDGSYGIAVSQVCELFLFRQNQASRDLKPLLPKDSSFDKVRIEGSQARRKVNFISLEDFDYLLGELAYSGNEKARELDRILRRLSLQQLWSDAFGIRFEKEERQAWIKERQKGKFYRRSLTDAIKLLKDRGTKIEYSYVTLGVYSGSGLTNAYNFYKATNNDSKFRETLCETDLRRIAKMEELIADYIIVDGMDYKAAIEKASKYIR